MGEEMTGVEMGIDGMTGVEMVIDGMIEEMTEEGMVIVGLDGMVIVGLDGMIEEMTVMIDEMTVMIEEMTVMMEGMSEGVLVTYVLNRMTKGHLHKRATMIMRMIKNLHHHR